MIGTPNDEYTIPRSVGGIKLEKTCVSAIGGKAATFMYEVEVYTSGEFAYVEKIIIKKDAEKKLESYSKMFTGTYADGNLFIDLSDIGDGVNIPEDWLDSIYLTIYVTQNAWKTNYQSYSNVIPVE